MLDQISAPVNAVLADGAYDGDPVCRANSDRHPTAAVIIPPRATAVPGQKAETTPTQRDHRIQQTAEKGRRSWQAATSYGRSALVESAFVRNKVFIGRGLRGGTLPAQKVDARTACAVLNRMTSLGIPVSRKLA